MQNQNPNWPPAKRWVDHLPDVFCSWCGELFPKGEQPSVCDCELPDPNAEKPETLQITVLANGTAVLGGPVTIEFPYDWKSTKRLMKYLRDIGVKALDGHLRDALGLPKDYRFVPAFTDLGKLAPSSVTKRAVKNISGRLSEETKRYEAQFGPIPFGYAQKILPEAQAFFKDFENEQQSYLPPDQRTIHQFHPGLIRQLCVTCWVDWRQLSDPQRIKGALDHLSIIRPIRASQGDELSKKRRPQRDLKS